MYLIRLNASHIETIPNLGKPRVHRGITLYNVVIFEIKS